MPRPSNVVVASSSTQESKSNSMLRLRYSEILQSLWHKPSCRLLHFGVDQTPSLKMSQVALVMNRKMKEPASTTSDKYQLFFWATYQTYWTQSSILAGTDSVRLKLDIPKSIWLVLSQTYHFLDVGGPDVHFVARSASARPLPRHPTPHVPVISLIQRGRATGWDSAPNTDWQHLAAPDASAGWQM